MSLIWHIIRKDAGCYRWALLFWGLLWVAQIALGLVAQANDGAELESVTLLQQMNGLLVALRFTTGYILVSRFVQTDELTGTRMFWLTRPISATRLLAAKVVGVGLFFALLPGLLLLPWWLYNGFGVREILWTSLDMLGWQLLMIAPAFLLASLTADLGRVLMWTLVIVTGLFAGVIILQSKLGISFGDPFGSSRVGVMFTRLWLADVVLVAGAMAIVVHQFLTRRSARSVGLTGALLGLVVLVGSIGWADWSQAFDGARLVGSGPTPPGLVEGVKFEVEPAEEVKYPARPNGREADRELRVRLRTAGLPEDMKLFGERIEQKWHWTDSLSFKRSGTGYRNSVQDADVHVLRAALALREFPADPETDAWRRARWDQMNAGRVARGQQPLPPPEPRVGRAGIILSADTWLPPSIMARMRAEPPAYTATVHGIIARVHLSAELPAKAGARGSGESRTFHILQQEGNRLALVTTIPSVKKTGLWQVLLGKQTGRREYFFRDRLVLVNRATGDISEVGRGYSQSPRAVQVGGVVIGWEAISLYPSWVVRNEKWVLQDPQWQDHSTLILLTDQEVTRFTREVKADGFRVRHGATDKPEDDDSF